MTAKELQKISKKEVEETTNNCRYYTPEVDIYEEKENIVLFVDMPGVKKENVNINLDNDVLTISGNIDQGKYEGMKPLYAEYNIGNYYRRFTLSDEINKDKIQANMDKGALKLILPKSEKVKPREIQIK